MREIKFRGKRLDNGEWVFGYFAMIMREKPKPGELTPRVDFCIYADDGEWYKVDPATVGQYTGLKDRDGKEIYEGDILKWNELIGVVTWNSCNCGWDFDPIDHNNGETLECPIAELLDGNTINAIVLGNPQLFKSE